MAGTGSPPVVHRPIPRRPFPSRPARSTKRSGNDSTSRDGAPAVPQTPDAPSLPRLLERQVQNNADSDGSAADLSRTQSIRNLTASTLFGIFSPSLASGSPAGGASGEGTTPWGTGAETPATDLLAGDDDDDDVDAGETTSRDEEFRRTTATEADLDEVRRASRSLMMLQYQNRTAGMSGVNRAAGAAKASAPGRQKDRAKRGGRRSSAVAATGEMGEAAATQPSPPAPSSASSPSRVFVLISTIGRAVLLFFLGMGYGALVTRLRSEAAPLSALDDLPDGAAPLAASEMATVAGSDAVAAPRYDAITDWRYLISWGVSGVVLGTLLPWFDGVWERAFGSSDKTFLGHKGRPAPDTDWALVVRGIGAFAGVAFAMRKLPWASTMQASLTLALANPFLWYLLDRSKSGLLLSAVFCFLGTGVLVTLDLDLLPNPGLPRTRPAGSAYSGGLSSSTGSALHPPSHNDSQQSQYSAAAVAAAAGTGEAGGSTAFHASASPAVTADTVIWMLSVLFCSCVCFGSIGRRLALRVPAAAGQQRP